MRHKSPVRFAAFSADDERVITISGDHDVQLWDSHSGISITILLKARERENFSAHPNFRQAVQLDSQTLVTSFGETLIWEVPDPPMPVPSWLPELAEAIGKKRLNSLRAFDPVSDNDTLNLQRKIEQDHSADFYIRWAKWFLAEPSQRTASPFSAVSIPSELRKGASSPF